MEALDREITAGSAMFPDTGDIVSDMRATITQVARIQADPNFGPPLAALIAEAQLDRDGGPKLLERLFKPRRAPIVERLRRAQERGELPTSVEAENILEVIFGALYHRLLLRSGPLDAMYAGFISISSSPDVQRQGRAGDRLPCHDDPASHLHAACLGAVDRVLRGSGDRAGGVRQALQPGDISSRGVPRPFQAEPGPSPNAPATWRHAVDGAVQHVAVSGALSNLLGYLAEPPVPAAIWDGSRLQRIKMI